MKKIEIKDTPETRTAIQQMADEARERSDLFTKGFLGALPGMPLSDELKAEFEKAAHDLQKRWGTPPK